MRSQPLLLLVLTISAAAQQAPAPSEPPATKDQTQVKINYLNVCTPTSEEQKELQAALDKIPLRPVFATDFEVSRGSTTLQDESARYVRLRRDMKPKSGFSNAQYSLSHDQQKITETLVMKLEEPKDLLMISLEDQITAASYPGNPVDVDTPVSRIKLERFGKSSLVLARCEGADQSAYEPFFQKATAILANYRKMLGLRSRFRGDLNWLFTTAKPAKPTKPAPATPHPSAGPAR